MNIEGLVGLVVFAIIAFAAILLKERKLNDPDNASMIFIDQMKANHALRKGPVSAALFRQSGNLYRDLGLFPSADEALKEVEKSFRRAGIDSVAVLKNTTEKYEVARLYSNDRGRAEGKRLGGALVVSE